MTRKNLRLNKKDFLKAMERVDRYGIQYSGYGDVGAKQCAIGHMCTVKGVDPNKKGMELAHANGFAHEEIASFNDGGFGMGTTKEELMTFFAFGAAGAFKDLPIYQWIYQW